LFLKKFIENCIKNFERHFRNHSNELIGQDFIMKVAGCRLQSSSVPIADKALLRQAVPAATRLLWCRAVSEVSTWSHKLRQIA